MATMASDRTSSGSGFPTAHAELQDIGGGPWFGDLGTKSFDSIIPQKAFWSRSDRRNNCPFRYLPTRHFFASRPGVQQSPSNHRVITEAEIAAKGRKR
jgi:hypothetical protein